ncbi:MULTISPECIES: class I SAM-dependent DNA methyltransferase [unclassified Butyrivibrio]|uniref:class I SAM-dependent DNA methyltransferase n=1 Tax=unclassified Butyrivibrio TaxID=2639466 RepID=UPI0003B415F1|nr:MULTISPECIES: class I SAM-dependent methyltransferase [unclassified Butyrivibrio]SEK61595.1 Methyltransferase domain-containing protein [Butyrivibrio sp. ob235]
MEAYTDFAKVYDEFMDETPYHDWAAYISRLISGYGISVPYKKKSEDPTQEDGAESQDIDAPTSQPGEEEEEDKEALLLQEQNLVVELGCGTGSFTEEMAKLGYDMIGIDNSGEMLGIARNKMEKAGLDIMYLEQDMCELDLFCTAGTIVSVCDSINYLIEDEQIRKAFTKVNNYLYPGGLFLFDFNTLHKYRDVIGNVTIAENREDCSFIWENFFDIDTNINEYDLTLFVKKDKSGDKEEELFERSIETHLQRGYTLDEMKAFIEQAGMSFITAIDADTHDQPTEDSERIYVLAREHGKLMN